jgi:hypothetical protein
VIVCDPTVSVEVAPLVAVPAAPRVTAAPKFVPSITNCTIPAGVPRPDCSGVTVAVKVTGWPKTGEVAEDVTVVVVAAFITVSIAAVAVLLLV